VQTFRKRRAGLSPTAGLSCFFAVVCLIDSPTGIVPILQFGVIIGLLLSAALPQERGGAEFAGPENEGPKKNKD